MQASKRTPPEQIEILGVDSIRWAFSSLPSAFLAAGIASALLLTSPRSADDAPLTFVLILVGCWLGALIHAAATNLWIRLTKKGPIVEIAAFPGFISPHGALKERYSPRSPSVTQIDLHEHQ